jgi:hypothetical protein
MAQQMNSGFSLPGRGPDLSGHPARQDHVPTDFGTHHHHKPTKAMIGIAILVVMGFLSYEFGNRSANPHASEQTSNHQIVASSNH